MRTVAFYLSVCMGLSAARGAPPNESKAAAEATPVEKGTIEWVNGFDTAVDRAKREKKPVLILFQEIPGCGTCTGYGRDVLSHPLIRDAAETLFVPVCVRNNSSGDEDARVLAHFKETAWNNPVVRIVTPDRKMLTDRVNGDYTVGGMANAMVSALRAEKREVPEYLELLAMESTARRRGVEKATFAMHCFWEGEAALGVLNGVVSTRPGFVAGKEVVEVEFDPTLIDFKTLLASAMKRKCASTAFTRSDAQQKQAGEKLGGAAVRSDESMRPDDEPKYYLSKSEYRFVPMTDAQASRVNAAIHNGSDPKALLSPGQIRLLDAIRQKSDSSRRSMIGRSDLIKAWGEACAAVAG